MCVVLGYSCFTFTRLHSVLKPRPWGQRPRFCFLHDVADLLFQQSFKGRVTIPPYAAQLPFHDVLRHQHPPPCSWYLWGLGVWSLVLQMTEAGLEKSLKPIRSKAGPETLSSESKSSMRPDGTYVHNTHCISQFHLLSQRLWLHFPVAHGGSLLLPQFMCRSRIHSVPNPPAW